MTEIEELRAALQNACRMIQIQRLTIATYRDAIAPLWKISPGNVSGHGSIAAYRLAHGSPAAWDIKDLAAAKIEFIDES